MTFAHDPNDPDYANDEMIKAGTEALIDMRWSAHCCAETPQDHIIVRSIHAAMQLAKRGKRNDSWVTVYDPEMNIKERPLGWTGRRMPS